MTPELPTITLAEASRRCDESNKRLTIISIQERIGRQRRTFLAEVVNRPAGAELSLQLLAVISEETA